jgi:hypothetical protein
MASNNIVQLNTISISRMMRAIPSGMATSTFVKMIKDMKSIGIENENVQRHGTKKH